MKKLILSILSLIVLLSLASCVNSYTPEGMADKSIKMSDKAHPIEESPLLGELPSISVRNSAALDSVQRLARDRYYKLKEAHADYDEMAKLGEMASAAEKLVDRHYEEKFESLSQQYVGLEIPCAWDTKVFSNVSAKITGYNSTRNVKVEITVTTVRPIGRYISAHFADSETRSMLDYALMCSPCGAGATFTVNTTVSVNVLGHTARILVGR